MIHALLPRTASPRRSIVFPETEEQKRKRENEEILDGFAAEHRRQFARECRGARYGILGVILTWGTIVLIAWRIW